MRWMIFSTIVGSAGMTDSICGKPVATELALLPCVLGYQPRNLVRSTGPLAELSRELGCRDNTICALYRAYRQRPIRLYELSTMSPGVSPGNS